jgi:hypothetical protein
MEEYTVGCESQFELIHPSWLVFIDEVGSNTWQAKDGNIGGEKYLCMKQGRPQSCTLYLVGFYIKNW